MTMLKAYCKKCEETVYAVKGGIFSFAWSWGILTNLLFWILVIASGGIWLFIVLCWHADRIFGSRIICHKCSRPIEKEDYLPVE